MKFKSSKKLQWKKVKNEPADSVCVQKRKAVVCFVLSTMLFVCATQTSYAKGIGVWTDITGEEIGNQEIKIRKVESEERVSRMENYLENVYLENDCFRNQIVRYALTFVGGKYISGGRSLQKGTDCSGFTSLIYQAFGYGEIGKVANEQMRNAEAISFEELKPGDLVFYGYKGYATHVGMYIGDGQIVHAANQARGISTDAIDYMKNCIGYGRMLQESVRAYGVIEEE